MFPVCLHLLWMLVDHPRDTRGPSYGWWWPSCGLSVTILGMEDNWPGKSEWLSSGWWLTILQMPSYNLGDGGWLSWGWWFTIIRIKGDHPGDIVWPPGWVSIQRKVVYHPFNGRWLSWGWNHFLGCLHFRVIFIFGMVGDHPRDEIKGMEGGWPFFIFWVVFIFGLSSF